jgi:uncharacterized lipoprotein YddW (UPF0748 family)
MMPLCLPGQSERVLSVFDFATTEAARAAWKPAAGVSPVGLFDGIAPVEKPGVRFPCNFSAVESRCYWDRTISEDFTNDTLITLRVYIGNPEPISSLTLYFRSGGGWYSNTFRNLQRGWQELRCARANFNFSGTPTGWHSIDGIRFSPWKSESTDTEIIATELRLLNPAIRIVRGTKSTAQDTATATAALIGVCLDAWGIDYGALTEEDVEEGALAGARLAIFPYSNSMTAAEIARIESFVAAGGKIIVFFTAPTPVFNLLGIRNQGSSGIAPKAMRFRTGIVDCVPSFVKQASWNFFKVALEAPDVRVLAEWEDAEGTSLGWPAWTLGNNGAYMSHILLDDDLEAKKQLMLALAVHFVPEIAAPIARNVLDAMGRIGEYVEFDEAVAAIRASALETPRLNRVEAHLTSATLLRASALESPTSVTLCEKLQMLTDARANLLEAYYRAQKSRFPELRGAWASYSAISGPYVEGWDKMAIDLSRNGFNAVMPYLATGGLAHYNSKFLPRSEVYEQYGDHIAACVRACKPRGIETHVRKLNYFLYYAPQSFVDDLRAQQRTQVDVDGNPVGSLCPSHPLNYELEMNVMLEIIDNYDIDGIHYDFIRYPDEKCCYCDGCRERFQADTQNLTVDWPTDCYSGALKEPYREWRREQITRLVRGMRNAVNERGRKVKISAAVFSNYPSCRTSVAQDWVAWIEQGYLDFVCPMDYTDSQNSFRSMVTLQMEYVGGRVPLCPGVGVASSNSNLTADQTIAQLLIARRLNADGFVLFVYNNYLADTILPNLRKGLTADPEKSAFWVR